MNFTSFYPRSWSPHRRRTTLRRGLSLLEVLISMFVLLVGLMGVAALLPAGRFQIMQGGKSDHAAMVGRSAFREMKIRGYLNPANWTFVDSTNTRVGALTST